MSIPLRLSGSITALASPFTAAGEIDLESWQRLLELQLAGDTQGLVVAGSTGEGQALYESEYDALLRSAVELVAGRVPVLAGTGLPSTAKTIEQSRRAAALGADAALVVTPPYVRPGQAGLIAHYRAIADDGALPVMLYNVPGRTGCDLLPETAAELATHERIIAIKEARTEPDRMQALLGLRADGFAVFSGDDPSCVRAMLAGADGVVSVASNVVPRAMARLCKLAMTGKAEAARALDAQLAPLFVFLGLESNPIPLKALLGRQGLGDGLRLPLTPLAVGHAAQLDVAATEVAAIELSCRDSLAA